MTLDDLNDATERAADDLGDSVTLDLDRETRNELAMLSAAFGADPAEIVRRCVHRFFRSTVDSGDLDFHLRQGYDVTYDEFLAGMTYDDVDQSGLPAPDDDRRYRQ